LFVARAGTKVSGTRFLEQALERGAVAVVAQEPLALPERVAYVRVENANLALALLAHRAVGDPARAMQLLGVTGTKGKTTITYLLRAVLRAAGHKCGLIGTVQLDDGVRVEPSTMTTPGPVELATLLARMRDNGVGHAALEISSHALHQQRVAGIPLAAALFTNLTGDHLDYHLTMENYAAAKALLFASLAPEAVAVINVDDPWSERMVQNCRARIVRLSLKDAPAADFRAQIRAMTSRGTTIQISGPDALYQTFESPLVGRHNVYNSLGVIAATHSLGVPWDAIETGLAQMAGVPGRLQAVELPGLARAAMPFQVFVDYAHTHDALDNVLTALRATMAHAANGRTGKLICLFGCGGDRDRTKRPKMAAVVERLADRVVLTSDNPRTENPDAIIHEVLLGFSAAYRGGGSLAVEPDRRAAIRQALGLAEPGDVVLLAGKGHENYQIIGTQKRHFDDVEEAQAALGSLLGEETRR
jgi:UDP-N-acetylmuramoyl-L-alanyl-D-glutamate--2,6-diaminopimelate ligase